MDNRRQNNPNKDTVMRRLGRLMVKHKRKAYTVAALWAVAYTSYKLYSSTVSSSSFKSSLIINKEIEKVIIFGVTVAFQKQNTKGWYLSERSMYSNTTLMQMLESSNTNYSWFPIRDDTVAFIFLNVVLPAAVMIWAMKKFIMPPMGKPNTSAPREVLTFLDIGGNEIAKEALLEIVDYIKDPAKYKVLGIRLPKGVLLYGPPGTGKTLLAKALAHECQVPFMYSCGADFVELYAGLGPKRVRELFQNARQYGKCIIFIDEIDSLGGMRGKGTSWKEFDNTLNQLLTEMDGFNGTEGITVIAATNQEDHLDEALLRPGRFDRKIKIELPDEASRLAILKIHIAKRNTFIPEDKLEDLVKESEGFTGAEIENIINEASFISLKKLRGVPNLMEGHSLSLEDLQGGMRKILKEKSDIELSKMEKMGKKSMDQKNMINMLFNQQVPNVINK